MVADGARRGGDPLSVWRTGTYIRVMPPLRPDRTNSASIALQPLQETSGTIASAAGQPGTQPVSRSVACLNCGTPLVGPFCAECGQRDVPPYPSVRELAVDAFWELSGWDGRFASTVRAPVARPGKLTREFLEGRRARYISPLRLYLMCSLVYCVLAAAVPNASRDSGEPMPGGLRRGDPYRPAAFFVMLYVVSLTA